MFLLMPKGMCAAASLRPRIPAHGTEVLAPSNGYYPLPPQRALFDTAPSPKKADLASIFFGPDVVMCATAQAGLALPTFERAFLHECSLHLSVSHIALDVITPREF